MSKLSNLTFIVATFILCFGCEKAKHSDYSQAFFVVKTTQGEPKSIDLSKSVVKWRGTKLMGTGSHEGIVRFKTGRLLFSGNKLTGGELIVDMKSIYNTDIPLSDPEPRKNITTHLNSDFETNIFPDASFVINKVIYVDDNHMEISGNLTIKSISNPITVKAESSKDQTEYKTEFVFNRFDWKVGENGTWLEKKLVDAEVKLSVDLYVK